MLILAFETNSYSGFPKMHFLSDFSLLCIDAMLVKQLSIAARSQQILSKSGIAAQLKNPGKNMVSHVSNASLKEAFNISPPKKNSVFVNKRVHIRTESKLNQAYKSTNNSSFLLGYLVLRVTEQSYNIVQAPENLGPSSSFKSE